MSRFLGTRFGDLLKNRSKLDQINEPSDWLSREVYVRIPLSRERNTGFQSDSSIAYATVAKWKRAQQWWKQWKFFQHTIKNISQRSGRVVSSRFSSRNSRCHQTDGRFIDSCENMKSVATDHRAPSSFATKAAKVVDIRNIMTPKVLHKLWKFSKDAWFYFFHSRQLLLQIVKSLIS